MPTCFDRSPNRPRGHRPRAAVPRTRPAAVLWATLGLALLAPPSARAETADLAAKMWWNQPKKIEVLDLEPAQRARMDRAAAEFLALRGEAVEAQRAAWEAFGDAVASGDAERIAQRAAELKAAMAHSPAAQVDLVVAVSAELSEARRRRLVQRYPRLLSRPWVISGPRRPQ